MRHHDIQLTGSVAVTGSFTIPVGTTDERPSNPSSGSLRVNTSLGGVVEVYNGNEWVTVGEQTGAVAAGIELEYLVIAGGGGGGSYGGGGAGGYLSSSLSSMESGSSITVTVGGGGAGSGNGYNDRGTSGTDSSIASAGGTSFTTVTSTSGGGGGDNLGDSTGVPFDGGSGGGGSDGSTGGTNAGASGTVGQGNDGGDGTYSDPNYMGGGGGGAGTAGADATTSAAGDGGDGLASSITGTSTTRAGGGGGVRYNTTGTWGDGGSGGGGDGGSWNGNTSAISSNTTGTANTGGGGGAGKAGGKGVVILAYPSASHKGVGGIVGDAGDGRKYHQFNTTGTFELGDANDFSIHTTNLVLHVDAGQYASRSGSAGLKDLSTYDNSLTMGSAGTLSDDYWWEFDGTNEGAQFERNGGSSASDVGHTGYGSFTGRTTLGFCVEFWFKSSAGDSSNTWGTPIVSRNSSDLYAGIVQHGGKLTWLHYDSSWQYAKSTTDINDGSWHHCVINNSSDETVDVWVDGTKEADGVSSAINPDSRHFKMDSLGRGYNGVNHDFDLGQLRVYDATLTDAQITQNYNATKRNFT